MHPSTRAGTVSQLGILRVRKSTQPARSVTPSANIQIVCCAFIVECRFCKSCQL